MYAITEKTEVESFYNYLNTISTSINFTKELEKLGQLAFLAASVQQTKDGFLATSVYSKPTHTDRYLHYSSHHSKGLCGSYIILQSQQNHIKYEKMI